MDNLQMRFAELFGKRDNVQHFFCPGRVNLIGEHIDYLGGLVMPTAISLGITALIRPNATNIITVHSTDSEETIELDLSSLPNSKQNNWSDFVLGVVIHLNKIGIELRGCELLLDSNLPKGSGLSSSAALEVLCYFMFHSVFGESDIDRVKMSLACQEIENEFICVNCGIMDQFAVANGKANHAIVLNCDSLVYQFVPLNLGEYSLLIINTNKSRTLADSAYNQRRQECDEALKLLIKHLPITNLVDASLDDLHFINNSVIKKRARHAITEQIRVVDSVKALEVGNLKAFGQLMNESHASLRDDYEVSCPELDFIVSELQVAESCLGARMTGAGFGGCCVALVESKSVRKLSRGLTDTYKVRFNRTPEFYHCKPSNGVHLVS
jgi:galactokinase